MNSELDLFVGSFKVHMEQQARIRCPLNRQCRIKNAVLLPDPLSEDDSPGFIAGITCDTSCGLNTNSKAINELTQKAAELAFNELGIEGWVDC